MLFPCKLIISGYKNISKEYLIRNPKTYENSNFEIENMEKLVFSCLFILKENGELLLDENYDIKRFKGTFGQKCILKKVFYGKMRSISKNKN